MPTNDHKTTQGGPEVAYLHITWLSTATEFFSKKTLPRACNCAWN